MMNFKDKINAIDAASMNTEELYAEVGMTEETYVANALKMVRKQRFLALAAAGRAKEVRLANRIKDVLLGSSPQSIDLRAKFSANPLYSFRNLEKMTDEQLVQIAKDMEILEILDEENE